MNGDSHAGVIESFHPDRESRIERRTCRAVMPEVGAIYATTCALGFGHAGEHKSAGYSYGLPFRWPNEEAS
jgi:hypothetical protein